MERCRWDENLSFIGFFVDGYDRTAKQIRNFATYCGTRTVCATSCSNQKKLNGLLYRAGFRKFSTGARSRGHGPGVIYLWRFANKASQGQRSKAYYRQTYCCGLLLQTLDKRIQHCGAGATHMPLEGWTVVGTAARKPRKPKKL